MSNLNETLMSEIESIIKETLNSNDMVHELIKAKLKTAIETAFDDAFKWGDIRHTIEKKIKETMVPAIESCDFSTYITRLDTMLSDLANDPDVKANKRILDNFRDIITPPNVKSVPIETIFERYCKFIAETIDTDGREVCYEDGPCYVDVNCIVEAENTKSSYSTSNSEHWRLTFHIGDDEESTEGCYNEPLNFDITLYRYSWYERGEYTMMMLNDPKSLMNMTSFEAYLNALINAGIRVTINDGLSESFYLDDSVTPEKLPEAEYR